MQQMVPGLQTNVQALYHVNKFKRMDERRDDGISRLG
jgi:hypothetical protein